MVWQTIKSWLMNYAKSLLSRDDSTWLKWLLTLLIKKYPSLFFMLMVVSCQNLRKAERYGSGIYKIGTRSLFVYLISPFVGYATYFICSALGLMYWWVGLLLWLIIVYLAYRMSLLVKGKFEAAMFPRNYETLRRFVIRNRCAL